MDESPVKLFLPKKRKCGVDASNCFICEKKGKNLQKPGDAGKTSFINALTVRERCGGYNLIDLNEIIDYEQKSFKSPYEDQVRWHKECYSTYVSKSNLNHIKQEDNHDSELTSSGANNESMLTRSTREGRVAWWLAICARKPKAPGSSPAASYPQRRALRSNRPANA